MSTSFIAPRFQIQRTEKNNERDLKGCAGMSATEMSGFDVFVEGKIHSCDTPQAFELLSHSSSC